FAGGMNEGQDGNGFALDFINDPIVRMSDQFAGSQKSSRPAGIRRGLQQFGRCAKPVPHALCRFGIIQPDIGDDILEVALRGGRPFEPQAAAPWPLRSSSATSSPISASTSSWV